jgi:hypothetical protein
MDTDSALWIAYDSHPAMSWLEPGLHVLANRDVNDGESRRVQRARDLVEPVQHLPLDKLLSYLQRICCDHQNDVTDREAICMHRDETQYGTVSSSILAMAPDLEKSRYLYASILFYSYKAHQV